MGASELPLVLGVTGASGAPYAVRLLSELNAREVPVRLIVSRYGMRLLQEECDIAGLEGLRAATGDWSRVEAYDAGDRGGTPASGSARSRGMVICPCSMGTLASVAAGVSRNLVERAADVTLKERRPLVVVPRESPLSAIHLENMLRLTRAGVTVLPAAPGFYHRPETVAEMVDFVVARILDHLGIEHGLGRRWSAGEQEVGG